MNLETFTKVGIRFDFCRFAVVPEIPHVQDVIYALRLSEEEKKYRFCLQNHITYIANVHLVATAVIGSMQFAVESKMRQIIAQAIIELCPDEARCLFNSAFVEAKELAGQEVPPKDANREQLLASCSCTECRGMLDDRGTLRA